MLASRPLSLLLIALGIITTASANAAVGVHIVTDFTQQFNFSPHSRQNPGGIHLIYRDLGFSWRPRLAFPLLDRKDRQLFLLTGLHGRFPVLMSFTNYGAKISTPQTYEFGADIGMDWFGFAKTLVSLSPHWWTTYTSTEYGSSGLPTTVTIQHWSIGLRLEVPILRLESEPGDSRVELGGLAAYFADQIKSISIDSTDPSVNDSTQSNSQGVGYRWFLGVFTHVRL